MTMNIEQRTLAAVNQYENASATSHKLTNTDDIIDIDGGQKVKSLPRISKEWDAEREALSVKAKPVKGWVAGETETDLNQQRRFTDGHTYLPKAVPALMNAEPDQNWIAYTADKSDVLSDVFGSKPVDLVTGLVITPTNNQYPKLAAFGAIYELADNSVNYTVKSFAQSTDKKTIEITLSNNSKITANICNAISEYQSSKKLTDLETWTKDNLRTPSIATPYKNVTQHDFNENRPSAMPILSAKDLIGVYVEVADADAGGSLRVFRKSGSAFIAEQLVTGRYSGGDSLPNSCPVWRFGRVDYCKNIASYKHSYTATNIGNINEITTSGGLWTGGSSVLKNGFKIWRATGAGAYIDFETSESDIDLLLCSAADTTSQLKCQIFYNNALIEEHVIKTNLSTDYEVFTRSIKNPVGSKTVKVRFTASDINTKYMMIGGVNCSIDELKYKDVDHISFHIIQDDDCVFNTGDGAQNYAIQEKETGKFGGESHGGEYVSRRNVYFDNQLMTLTSGTFFNISRLSIENRSQVVWQDSVKYMDVTSSLTLTSDGSQFYGSFNPVNIVATTAYFAMFTYDQSFSHIKFPKYVDTSTITDRVQIQMPQASGFTVMNPSGQVASATWSEIYNTNPNYKPYIQMHPNPHARHNKHYYGVALPPENGITLRPFAFTTLRKYIA